MKKVITYGTYDLLHRGHIALLRRAKALGDYLIVGVTADSYDKERGKLNVTQTLAERIEAVRRTGIADQIIVEEYEGQKITDIQKYDADIFTVGSDWVGKFDYLSEYCQVVYLPRTRGVSSTELREKTAPKIRIGIIGCDRVGERFYSEVKSVSGIEIVAAADDDAGKGQFFCTARGLQWCKNENDLLEQVDAVFLNVSVDRHYALILKAIENHCHVISDPPLFMRVEEANEAYRRADEAGVVLFEGIKTLYFPAFEHMLLLIKSGKIGSVKDVDVACSQIPANMEAQEKNPYMGSMYDWASTALLPIIKIYESDCVDCQLVSLERNSFSYYVKGMLQYPEGSASFKVGKGLKTEGDLVITGTKGYIYVPAPWWRPEYFEIRYEDLRDTKKYFFNYEGDGLRYMIYKFVHAINEPSSVNYQHTRKEILRAVRILEQFDSGNYRRIDMSL